MNVSIEKIDNVNGKITVSIEENDYKDKVTSELNVLVKLTLFPVSARGMLLLTNFVAVLVNK